MTSLRQLSFLLFFIPLIASSQFVNETRLPVFQEPISSSSITRLQHHTILHGATWQENEFIPGSGVYYGSGHMFLIDRPLTPERIAVTVPVTAYSYSMGFGGYKDGVRYSLTDTKDSIFLAWSKVRINLSDVGPFVSFTKPELWLMKLKGKGCDSLTFIPNALNPSIAADVNGDIQIAYEMIDTLSSGKPSFVNYRGSILYQKRLSNGTLLPAQVIGKGFLPQVIAKGNSTGILWFEGDSSDQRQMKIRYRYGFKGNFGAVITIASIMKDAVSSYLSNTIGVNNFDWDIDSLGGVHCAWIEGTGFAGNRKIYFGHGSEASVKVDSTPGYSSISAKFRFMPDGSVHSASIISISDIFIPNYYSSVSSPKLPFVHTKKNYAIPNGHLVNAYITDTAGTSHVILSSTSLTVSTRAVYIVKDFGADSVKPVVFAKGYVMNDGAVVDEKNRLWMTGRNDSIRMLLDASLTDVVSHENITFPLGVGDLWQYIISAGPGDPKGTLMTVKAVKDSVLPNGKRYIVLSTGRALRKEGLRVYAYSPEDSLEYLQYDFTKSAGDTLSSFTQVGVKRAVVLQSITNSYLGKKYRFIGTVAGKMLDGYATEVTDSIGITGMECGLCESYVQFSGARLSGRTVGTVLGVNDPPAPVPYTLELLQNYPNPFNPETQLEFRVPQNGMVSLRIYDVLGREVAQLMHGYRDAGTIHTSWNASRFAGGIYVARLEFNGASRAIKMLLLK
ncbi:MAG: T9SS type A sorting domain-containing protein [Bacteroidota bacterium]